MNIQCDKCRKIYNSMFGAEIRYRVTSMCQEQEHHVCPSCSDQIRALIENTTECKVCHEYKQPSEFIHYSGTEVLSPVCTICIRKKFDNKEEEELDN